MAGGRTKGAKQDEYGTKIALVDRRREAWALRARGLSFRQIGEELGVAPYTAWKDCQKAEKEWGEIQTDPAQLREGLLQLHAQVSGHLVRQLEQQAANGKSPNTATTTATDRALCATGSTLRWLPSVEGTSSGWRPLWGFLTGLGSMAPLGPSNRTPW